MLDRVGAEQARATSIVRYAAGSRFPRHEHPGGEEILVLSGVFSDEGAQYPPGWYIRNPPGSGHAPFSDEGAVIFVKLRQMPDDEHRSVRIDTRDPSRWTTQRGRECCPLFADHLEQVSIERVGRGARVFDEKVEAAEMLVLEGSLHEGAQRYVAGSWIRLPSGLYPEFTAGETGASLYLKTGRAAGKAGHEPRPC